MRHSVPYTLAGIGLVGLLAACAESGPFERDVSIVLTPTASTVAAGVPVALRFDVRGTALVGIIVDYGDMVVDSLELRAATEASGPLVHTYGAAGTFEVEATAVDAVIGSAWDTVTVTVTP